MPFFFFLENHTEASGVFAIYSEVFQKKKKKPKSTERQKMNDKTSVMPLANLGEEKSVHSFFSSVKICFYKRL